MKSSRFVLAALLLGAAAASGSAWADRGHHGGPRFGVYFGPYFGPWGYPPPLYYPPYQYPPVVIERSAPTVYIEQSPPPPTVAAAPPPTAPATNWWYFCNAANAYYPYVRECPGGWQKVAPQPPGQP
jgi:hypothetical protein